ncbi:MULTISPECIES: rod shape-determining protein MreD [Rodentibacter]|uniref:Rod shape-determining protein MreD n=1 Tax=Rodentibacter pneumotropicus TaxID=758 RepID=A0A4S2PRV0_9PAST|nr:MULTISPECIES: rod shape-determining protein MreD [Rodentibacter]MDC2825163.1 rod shape-determining protein MreD [Rodentibacter pneumotropicus]OOF60583.1 rod shape-determining protein MreD [Rodentibacter pneumotropicus]TGZ99619.1 rod shape-determining protein MreD [Rodentibacter pneumotropicus]THA02953.1 rod shape-determining protein MreD [Rodentibacter pneumotropicus]THA05201.1 rod shape-determining protein MreD [Rodentibacter pneumotropicus]
MQMRLILQWVTIILFFVVSLVMELAPWPIGFQAFKPSWLVLVLTYWALAIPNKVSIGIAFLLGVIWDIVLGSTLGIHALVLSVAFYFIAKNYLVLRNLSLWFQSLLVIIFVFSIRFAIFLVELFLHSAVFNWQEIFGAIASGILWPWVFLLMRKMRRKVGLS